MSRQQNWLCTSLVALCFVLLLNGCGSGATPTQAAAPSPVPAYLNGNWLLTGTLPLTTVAGNPLNTSFGAAVTISVIDNNLIATFDRNDACFNGNGVASGPIGVISGAVASDGTFSMITTSTILSDSATVTGTLPATIASSWTGHLDLTDHTTLCAINRTQNFTAVRIADVTGTYGGTATLNGALGGTLQPPQNAFFTFTLQQGNTAPGTPAFDAALVSGSVAVQGTTCFVTGTLPLPVANPGGIRVPISSVQGSEIELQATMNDGSTVSLIGHLMDTPSSRIYVSGMFGS